MSKAQPEGAGLRSTSLISAETVQTGKEVKYMKYEKPNIALIASAVEAVKGDQTKHADPTIDCPLFVTSGAYQSDE